jgi:xanthine dehydrogenase accessory factor
MGLYDTIVEYIDKGLRGSIVTVVEKTGAAPRDKGAKMFVAADGAIFGTIGGGSVEAFACSEALRRQGEDLPVVIPYRMEGARVEDEGMLCGGDVTLLMEPVLARHRDLYERIGFSRKRGWKAVLITRFRGGAYSKSLFDGQETLWGDHLESELLHTFKAFIGRRGPIVSGDFVIEPIEPIADLIIFGAGHVSLFVARMAKMVHFNVTVVDDREEFANAERFPEADHIVVGGFSSVFEGLQFSEETYAVIVTRGHKYDAVVLEECLKRPGRYIGMIGSARKVRMVMDYLREKGFSDGDLAGVHAPIGIDIHSETPEEIGVSIVAELIQARGEVQSGRR